MTVKRLRALDLDGVVLYDIDDESDRKPGEAPVPVSADHGPCAVSVQAPRRLGDPAVYRAVGKYVESQLRSWLDAQEPDRVLTVFVGTSSRDGLVATSLTRAQALRSQLQAELRRSE